MSAAAGGSDCIFCEQAGGAVLWRGAHCRVVRPDVEGYPGFLRVILERHVREMTDLESHERDQLMQAVFAAESALRAACRPLKVNLASFGNQVPHLHWHVIARFGDDPHFPEPPFGPALRAGAARAPLHDGELGERLSELLDA